MLIPQNTLYLFFCCKFSHKKHPVKLEWCLTFTGHISAAAFFMFNFTIN
jgi:hypothetical protein